MKIKKGVTVNGYDVEALMENPLNGHYIAKDRASMQTILFVAIEWGGDLVKAIEEDGDQLSKVANEYYEENEITDEQIEAFIMIYNNSEICKEEFTGTHELPIAPVSKRKYRAICVWEDDREVMSLSMYTDIEDVHKALDF